MILTTHSCKQFMGCKANIVVVVDVTHTYIAASMSCMITTCIP